jgi:hypothetical protein
MMRIISAEKLTALLGAQTGTPRVVAGGNFATPGRPWPRSTRPSPSTACSR